MFLSKLGKKKKISEEKTKPLNLGKDFQHQIPGYDTLYRMTVHLFLVCRCLLIIIENDRCQHLNLRLNSHSLPTLQMIQGGCEPPHKLCPGHIHEVPLYSNISYCSPRISASFQTTGQLGIPNVALVKILTELPVSKLA